MDIQNLFMLLIIGHAVMGIMSFAYYQMKPMYVLKLSVIAQVVFSVAYGLIYLRAVFPCLAYIILSNCALVGAIAVQSITILYVLGKWSHLKRTILTVYLVIIMSIFTLTIATGLQENFRMSFFSIILISLLIHPTYTLITTPGRTPFRTVMATFLSVTIVAFIARSWYAMCTSQLYTFDYQHLSNTFAYTMLYILMIANGLGLLFLIKEDDDRLLVKAATTDPLTGILNRYRLITAIEDQIAFHRRKTIPLSMLVIDIDYFKNINDTYGHPVGDIVLKKLVHLIEKHLRPYDLFGRIGGEEFVIVLPQTDHDSAAIISERLRETVASTPLPDLHITISIGIHIDIPDLNADYNHYFCRADHALYQAKSQGRNRVVFYDGGSECP